MAAAFLRATRAAGQTAAMALNSSATAGGAPKENVVKRGKMTPDTAK